MSAVVKTVMKYKVKNTAGNLGQKVDCEKLVFITVIFRRNTSDGELIYYVIYPLK